MTGTEFGVYSLCICCKHYPAAPSFDQTKQQTFILNLKSSMYIYTKTFFVAAQRLYTSISHYDFDPSRSALGGQLIIIQL